MSPKVGLDRSAVTQAAARLANREGVEALTINRLARELGVRPPSLYNHIDGLADLYRELALCSNRVLAEEMTAAAVGQAGAPAIFALARAYRGFIVANPGLYMAGLRAAIDRRPNDAELAASEERVVNICLAVIAAFDLRGEDALHAVRGLRSLVHGFATLELAGGFGLPLSLDESFRRLIEQFARGLSPAP